MAVFPVRTCALNRCIFGLFVFAALGIASLIAPTASAQSASSSSSRINDGPAYKITSFSITYYSPKGKSGAGLPDIIKDVMQHPILLSQISGKFVVPQDLESRWRDLRSNRDTTVRPSGPAITGRYTLASLASPQPRLYQASAIWAIEDQIREYFNNEQHLLGVFVQPADTDIGPNLRDLRRNKSGAMRLVIYVGRVAEIRSLALGERYPQGPTVGAIHRNIRDNSPVQPATPGNSGTTDLLRQDLIDDYIYRLNRQPGRRVDVAVSALSGEPADIGKVVLDYRVTEVRPWSVYFQTSNTGTRATSSWRERFGYINNQLFGHDDVMSLDYSTASFSQSHTVIASYEAPIPGTQKWRWRLDGSFDVFTESDLGISNAAGTSFHGEEAAGGASVIYNAAQWGNLFLDVVGAVRFEYDSTQSNVALQSNDGYGDFIVPSAGVRLQKTSDEQSLSFEGMLAGRLSDTGASELNKLGRLDTDRDAMLFTGNVNYDVFLEPILAPEAFKSGHSTVAHELILSARGQYAFGSRLVPQAEEVAGGFYTVRGYPESVSSGDSVIVCSTEYRYHIPRALTPSNEIKTEPRWERWLEEKNFRFRPRDRYQRPDWDLALVGFLDAGYTLNSKREAFEKDQTLVGIGAGINFSFKQNVTLALDYGVALTAVQQSTATEAVSSGSSRLHFSLTLTY